MCMLDLKRGTHRFTPVFPVKSGKPFPARFGEMFVPHIVQPANLNASEWSVFQSQNCDFASSATSLPSCVPLVVSQFAKLLATASSTSCGSCRSRATATYVFTGGSYSARMHSFHKRLPACCCRCGRTTKAASGRLPAAVGTWG